MARFRDHYRPERHYMRGPGPKWHAKHTASLVSAASAQRSTLSLSAGPAAETRHRPPFAAWIASTAAAALLGFVVVMMLA